MCNVLVRGLPDVLYREMRRYADAQDLSVNQVMVKSIREGFVGIQREKKDEAEQKKVFDRIKELRGKLHKEFGRREDSTAIIRHFRDTRNW